MSAWARRRFRRLQVGWLPIRRSERDGRSGRAGRTGRVTAGVQLELAGILERHAFRDGRARYEKASKKHHDHLIDLNSGQVVEFRSPEIERLQAEIARRFGYRLVGHRLELYAVPI